LALKSNGTIWAWGFNQYGQLGDGTTVNHTTPIQIHGLNNVIATAAVVSVHSVALKDDGTVWAWGKNYHGQLGDGTTIDCATPVQVLGPGSEGFLNLLQTSPPPSGGIVMELEEPAAGSTYSGIANVRGWAVASSGMDKVELYVDDQLYSQIPLGGRRIDVGTAYPDYPGAAQSGFAMAFNYSGLSAGPHTFTVRAHDVTGGARDTRVTANVVRFANPYMADPAAVNLDQATLRGSSNTLTVQSLRAEGQPYTVQLHWRPATQGFALTQINPASRPTLASDVPSSAPLEAPSPAVLLPVPRVPARPEDKIIPLQALPADAGDDIVMALEEPAAGSTYSGIAIVRGWAVAPSGVEKVELYVDDQFYSQIPLGGRRADVGAAYLDYPGAAQSGFAMVFNYSGLSAGAHTFTVRALDASGGGRDTRVTANVVRFANPYMADPAAVNLDQATLRGSSNTLTIQNLRAAGQPYTVRLDWRPATQGFTLTQIVPDELPPALPIGALEAVDLRAWSGWACEPGYPSTSLQVELQQNSNRVATVQADLSRADISAQCGSPNHGFSWKPGSGFTISSGDQIDAYALHATGDGKTLIGSKVCTFECSDLSDITSCKLLCN
jgi:hypothetical protein